MEGPIKPSSSSPGPSEGGAAVESPPRDVAQPPTYRPTPPTGKGSQAVFLDFNQSPREIVQVMDEAQQKAQDFNTDHRYWRTRLWLLFLAGIPFLAIDWAMGYNTCTFSLVTLTLWLGAIFGLRLLRRQGKMPEFGPKFDLARTIFETLKDDVSPKRTMSGWLDLTGAKQESKETRRKSSRSGQPIVYYQDEWLRLKTRLYDGNVLRLSLIERVKHREDYWKRSLSGKYKRRYGSSEQQHQLKFSVSVNLDTYQIQPLEPVTSISDSHFLIEQAEAGEGRLVFKAATAKEYDAWDVLNIMRFGYDQLQEIEEI